MVILKRMQSVSAEAMRVPDLNLSAALKGESQDALSTHTCANLPARVSLVGLLSPRVKYAIPPRLSTTSRGQICAHAEPRRTPRRHAMALKECSKAPRNGPENCRLCCDCDGCWLLT